MEACPSMVKESPEKLGSPGKEGICAPELAPMVENAGCRLTLLTLTGGKSAASHSEERLSLPLFNEKFTCCCSLLSKTSVLEVAKPKRSARIRKRSPRERARE